MIDYKLSALREALCALGFVGEVAPPEPRFVQHMEVLANAMAIHVERTSVRGDTWASFDHHDSIHHLSSKLARMKAASEMLAQLSAARDRGEEVEEEQVDKLIDAILDDALDLINYAVFVIRHLTGRKPVHTVG